MLKRVAHILPVVIMAACVSRAVPKPTPGDATSIPFKAVRLPDNPIIVPDMDARMIAERERYGYVNINGPSLIKVPDWVKNPLGKYYLYFAHHKGEYIRLAYADDIDGPWKTYEPGALDIAASFFPTENAKPAGILTAGVNLWKQYPPSAAWALTKVGVAAVVAWSKKKNRYARGSDEAHPHIASPDVIVDHDRREIRMYYHGMLEDRNQMTRVAVSKDGLNFQAREELLTSPYLRVFGYRGAWYGISMPGLFCRSEDGLTNFETRPGLLFGSNMRHCALFREGDTLYIFFTRVGDAPERILLSTADLSPPDWKEWKASGPVEILRPERDWEGADLLVEPSLRGENPGAVNQLRDPAIYIEGDRLYLLYSCAGEQSIAIAELLRHP